MKLTFYFVVAFIGITLVLAGITILIPHTNLFGPVDVIEKWNEMYSFNDAFDQCFDRNSPDEVINGLTMLIIGTIIFLFSTLKIKKLGRSIQREDWFRIAQIASTILAGLLIAFSIHIKVSPY